MQSAAAIAKWTAFNNRYGRHQNHPLQRTALDIVSYEAKAAVRRCYSCAWNDLIAHLAGKYQLPEPARRFLQLMHTERIVNGDGPKQTVGLFHGHVFALHPAMSLLMQTSTGQRLMGAYVSGRTAEECLEPFQQLLRAIYLSLYHYQDLRERHRRRNVPRSAGDAAIEEHDTQARSGRRRRGH